MRILVLKHRRAGGFNLSQWIASELQLHHYHEPLGEDNPFNRHNAERALYGGNVVIEEIPESIKEFGLDYEEYLNTFDKIICLTRNDIKECAISLQTFIRKDKYEQYNIINTDWLNLNQSEFNLNEEYLNKSKIEILNVINGLQVTYEDIFETKKDVQEVVNYLGMNKLRYIETLNIIDPAAKKLRNISTKKLI
jgi:hypothetical protein